MLQTNSKKADSILRIAFELFLEKGYEATSIRQICKKVGIEPPTLYYFFGSKKSLFFSIVTQLWENYLEQRNDDVSVFLDVEDKLFHLYRQNVKYTIDNSQDVRFFLRFSLFPPSELKEEIAKFLNECYEKRRNVIRELMEESIRTSRIDLELNLACHLYWKFINNAAMDIILWNWQPHENEIKELWKMFYKCQLKQSVF